MKQLSIEQKAKRYDEAIEIAKDSYNYPSYPGFIRADVVFPELKESEGEKISAALIKLVKKAGEGYENILEGVSIQKAISWLEKQGEQKHTAEEVLIKAGLKPYKDGDHWCVLLGDNIQEGICGFGNTIEDALYAFLKDLIVNQGEQKPVGFNIGDEITVNGQVCRVVAVDKDAWSEEDENLLNRCVINTQMVDSDDTLKIWLNSLKDRVLPQPKQEWSEEDEKMLKDILVDVKYEGYNNDMQANSYKRINWLKSFRLKHTWKPSDEQMDALDGICSYIRNKADWEISQDMVSDLYKLSEQLKKLRGEKQ